jgi:hypothetical protein
MKTANPTGCLVLLALSGALLSSCAETYPGGVAATAGDAIAIAERICGNTSLRRYPAPWHGKLIDGIWQLWKPHLALRIHVDAATGRASSCEGAVIE